MHSDMRVAPTSLAALMLLAACDPQGEAEAASAEVELDRGTVVQATPEQTAPPNAEPPPEPEAVAEPEPEAAAEPEAEAEPEPPPKPQRPKPPEGYGKLSPSSPPPDASTLTHHALAGYEVVAIHDKPDASSPKLGYIRLGTRLKVTKRVPGKGCGGAWHQLPDGGFACTGRGLVVHAKREPFIKYPPPPPDKEAATPYQYAYVKQYNTPMWWRLPTAEERAEAARQRAKLEAARKGEPTGETPAKPKPKPKPKPDAAPKPEAAPKPKTAAASKPNADADPIDKLPVLASTNKPLPPPEPAPAPEPEPEPDPIKLPLNPSKPWLEKGFFISLGAKVHHDGQSYWRTARGGYVSTSATYKWGTKDFAGAELPEEASFPFGFVMARKGTKLIELDDEGKLIAKGHLEYKTFVDVSEEIIVNRRAYMVTEGEGLLVRKDHLRLADPQPQPEGLRPYDRWVDVSLDKQMLVAYEGTHPVFVTLVSTGKKGTKEEPFDTPTGRWRIRSKHVTTTMDGGSASDGNYSIQDVPWTMYFHESFALHGAFWHNSYGRVRSHGCVNLGPSSARWLFQWTTPSLPEGWHGVHSHDGSPGTTVVVRR